MNIYLNEKIDFKNIMYQKPIQNKLEIYKNFYKIIYTHPKYTMNYLLVPLKFSSYNIDFQNGKYKLIVNKMIPFSVKYLELKTILTSLNMITEEHQISMYF